MPFVLPLIAFLMIVASWTAWRRSPLYSVRITIQLVGAFLLLAGAIVTASVAISDGPLHSPIAQGVLGGISIVVLGTGATGVIIRLTDSHVAHLPPEARLITTHRHKVQQWIWRTAVYLMICAGAGLALPDSWNWLPLALGGFVFLLCGPMLMGFYMRARRLDLGMSQVMAAAWVHWQYPPAQWESWAQSQLAWERSKETDLKGRKLVFFLLFCFGLFTLGALISGGSLKENVIIVTGLSAFVALLVGGLSWFGRGAYARRNRRLLAAPAESWFGDEGIFCNGEFVPWTLSGDYLQEATAPRDPPARLVLVFQTFNGSNSRLVARRVLIPEGGESDLAMLQQKLNECCRTASVQFLAPAR